MQQKIYKEKDILALEYKKLWDKKLGIANLIQAILVEQKNIGPYKCQSVVNSMQQRTYSAVVERPLATTGHAVAEQFIVVATALAATIASKIVDAAAATVPYLTPE